MRPPGCPPPQLHGVTGGWQRAGGVPCTTCICWSSCDIAPCQRDLQTQCPGWHGMCPLDALWGHSLGQAAQGDLAGVVQELCRLFVCPLSQHHLHSAWQVSTVLDSGLGCVPSLAQLCDPGCLQRLKAVTGAGCCVCSGLLVLSCASGSCCCQACADTAAGTTSLELMSQLHHPVRVAGTGV